MLTTTHTKITEMIPNNFGSIILPPMLPNLIPKTISVGQAQGFGHHIPHDDSRDELLSETILFGNHGNGITENNSKIINFSSEMFLCAMVGD